MQKQKEPKRLMDPGCPVISQAFIYARSTNVKVLNPEKMLHDKLALGCLGRVHSRKSPTVLNVWVCDEATSGTIQLEVPQGMMGQLFKVHAHNMYEHFA